MSPCWLTHNIAPHISWHDLPYHKTTKKYSDFPSLVVFFRCSCEESGFEHGSVTVNNIFACFTLSMRTSQVYMIKDVGSPKSTSLLSTFHTGSMFCFFPANLMSSTYTDKNSLFHGARISIPNWKLSPNRTFIGLSQIAFPTTILPKDNRTDSVQEERLGLPYWTMILAMCVVVGRIHMSGHSDLGIFKQIVSIFHFYLGVSRYCVRCLSCATRQSGDDIHDLGGCHLRC